MMELSRELIHFLYTTVKLMDRALYTDLYCKPTDSHSYLLYNSAHPYHCKKSTPYSQLLRIRKICSSLRDFDRHAQDFASYFQNRGYPSHLIEGAYIKGRRMDWNHLLDNDRSPKDARSKDNTILDSTYDDNKDYLLKLEFPGQKPQHNIPTPKQWWMHSAGQQTYEIFWYMLQPPRNLPKTIDQRQVGHKPNIWPSQQQH